MSIEQEAAKRVLIATTQHVSNAIPSFSKWLMAGFGAAFALTLANISSVIKFIGVAYIRYGLLLFLFSLILAIVSTYLGAIVNAAVAAQNEGEAIGNQIAASKQHFNLDKFIEEYERGLFKLNRWVAHRTFEKVINGDVVAGARMIAKLSQIQTFLILAQGLFAIIAVGILAYGLRAH